MPMPGNSLRMRSNFRACGHRSCRLCGGFSPDTAQYTPRPSRLSLVSGRPAWLDSAVQSGPFRPFLGSGEVAERLNAPHSKCGIRCKRIGGSNPSLSAKLCSSHWTCVKLLLFNGFVLPDWYTRVVHMPLAMSRPWKHPNSGVYWLRKRVPDDLRAQIGKREEKRSLGTRNPEEAKRRHAQLMTELDERWNNLRAGPRNLTEREAHEIAARAYEQHLAKYSENPSEQKIWDLKIGENLWAETGHSAEPLEHAG